MNFSIIKARVYNGIGMLLFVLEASFGIDSFLIPVMLFPLVGIALIAESRGAITFWGPDNSGPERIIYGMGFSVAALFIKYAADYYIADYWPIMGYMLLTGTGFGLALRFADNFNIEGKWIKYAGVAVISWFYMYNIALINCAYDRSPGSNVAVTILSHEVSHGKSDNYLITYNDFTNPGENKETEVSKITYDNYPVGSKLVLKVKKGLLHALWYQLPD